MHACLLWLTGVPTCTTEQTVSSYAVVFITYGNKARAKVEQPTTAMNMTGV
jgi:hypothetical protein